MPPQSIADGRDSTDNSQMRPEPVEVRNHWRRDALMGEDGSRSRNANLLANVALLRSALLALVAGHHPDPPLPQLREPFHSRSSRSLNLLIS